VSTLDEAIALVKLGDWAKARAAAKAIGDDARVAADLVRTDTSIG